MMRCALRKWRLSVRENAQLTRGKRKSWRNKCKRARKGRKELTRIGVNRLWCTGQRTMTSASTVRIFRGGGTKKMAHPREQIEATTPELSATRPASNSKVDHSPPLATHTPLKLSKPTSRRISPRSWWLLRVRWNVLLIIKTRASCRCSKARSICPPRSTPGWRSDKWKRRKLIWTSSERM